MNQSKMRKAEAEMMKVEQLRRRIEHAPPELIDAMTEELDRMFTAASQKVRDATESEEEG